MLAIAKCGHCNGTTTKITEIEPNGAQFKQSAICCGTCNAILSTTGFYDAGALVKRQEKEIALLKQQVAQIDYNLQQVLSVLQRR